MLISCCNYVYISQVVSWLRDVQVKYVTNTSAIIQYTTADCVVNELENLTIELIISGDDSPVINPSSPVLYENATTSIFNLNDLQPNDVLTYTLQVITEAMGSTITIGRIHTGSITVSPTPSSTTTTSTLVTIRATSSGISVLYSDQEHKFSYSTSHLLLVNIVASTCTPCDSSSEGMCNTETMQY